MASLVRPANLFSLHPGRTGPDAPQPRSRYTHRLEPSTAFPGEALVAGSKLSLAASAFLSTGEMARFLLALGVMLGLARVLGEITRRYRQPAVLGEIVAGILLGPTVLGQISPTAVAWLFPASGPVGLATSGLVTLAATLLLFVVGMDVDLSTVLRQGRAALAVSVGGILLPFSLGIVLASVAHPWLGKGESAPVLPFALFVGIALSITALPVIAKILVDLNMAKTDLGMLILASAMMNDLVGWLGFALVLSLMHGGGVAAVGGTVVVTMVFLVLMLTVGRWLFHWTVPVIQAHWSYPGGVLGVVLTVALLCAAFTEAVGIHSIFGAFVAGIAIGDSDRLRQRTRETIHQFIMNVFAPLFFVSIGLSINFVSRFNPLLVTALLAVAVSGKVLGCYLGAKWSGMAKRESWGVAFGMAAQGAVGIILGQLALNHGLITQELMVAIVFVALATSIIAGPAAQRLFRQPSPRELAQLLSERQLIWRMQAGDARHAIRELALRAAEVSRLPFDEIDQAVWAREQIMPTGVGEGVAVPHAALDGLAEPLIIIGLSHTGVDFDAPDGQPANIVCLLLSPRKNVTAQVEMLQMVSRAFAHAEVRALVLAAQNYTQFLAALKLAGSHAPL